VALRFRSGVLAVVLVGAFATTSVPAQANHCPYPPDSANLSLNAHPLVVTAGTSTFFKGYLTQASCPSPGRPVNTYVRYVPNGNTQFRGTVTTNTQGIYSRTLAFNQNYAVRTLFPGETGHPKTLSRELTIAVRTRISASVSTRGGCVLQWGGATFPRAPAGTLAIIQRSTASGIQSLASTRARSGGGFSVISRLPCGRYPVRIITNRTATNADGLTPFATITV
jgi:hypothetical protein